MQKRRLYDGGAVILLLVAAWFLFRSATYHVGYGGHYHRFYVYAHSYGFYERLRLVVCGAWIVAAIRFYAYRWIPVGNSWHHYRMAVQSALPRNDVSIPMATV